MKVGILAYDLASLRGGVKLSLILGSKLKDAGFDVAYACAKEDLKNLEKKFGMELQFKVYKPKLTFLRDKMINITSLWNQGIPAYHLCREFKPDVVIEIGGVITPLLIPWFLKVPTIHYCYCPASLYKEFTYYKQSWMQNLYPAFVSKIESFAIKKADKVISMCRFSQDIVKKIWGINTVSIPPPTNINMFKPAKKKKIILSVSIFTRAYQLEKLIEIFEKIKRPDYRLYIIGQLNTSVPEDVAYFNKIKSMAEKKCNIFVDYHIDFDVMLDLYRSSRVFWYSYWAHFGLNNADAQSCGTPAIAVRLPEKWGKNNGPAEVIRNNLTGFMVDSVSDFYEKTLTLLNDQELWAKMSRASRKNAIERLGEDKFIKLFKKEIESLVKTKQS